MDKEYDHVLKMINDRQHEDYCFVEEARDMALLAKALDEKLNIIGDKLETSLQGLRALC